MIERLLPHQALPLATIPEKEHPKFLDVEYSDRIPKKEMQSMLASLPEHGLAIVGTRYPQRRSIELMEKTFDSLKGYPLVIISGFARGIDSCAHELAIQCGFKTIAILGCGIHLDYPRENRHLRRKILESGGLVISPFERDSQAYAGNFLKRNKYIAGFSKATWVVEGAAVSGTLNTANWANQFSRDLYATPCFPGDIFYQGNEKLLSEKETLNYPLAKPFFGTHSLSFTWRFIDQSPQLSLEIVVDTQIQKWVLELKTTYGSCHIQSLMNLAHLNGLTPGKFYLQFEEEIKKGLLNHHPDGSVTIGSWH